MTPDKVDGLLDLAGSGVLPFVWSHHGLVSKWGESMDAPKYFLMMSCCSHFLPGIFGFASKSRCVCLSCPGLVSGRQAIGARAPTEDEAVGKPTINGSPHHGESRGGNKVITAHSLMMTG